jgi:hypothetical protein
VGKIPRGVLKRAKAQLDNVKANLIGVILNGLKAELSSDYADYKYKYYYYFSRKTDNKPETPAEKIRALPARFKTLFGIAPGGFSGGKETELRPSLSGGSIAARTRQLRLRRAPAGPRPEEKKISMVKAGMLLIAFIFLTMGILYQMGVLKFSLPSLNAQKLQHRGASIHREGLVAADALIRVAAQAGSPVYRAKLRPAGQTNSLQKTSAGQGGGHASSLSAIAYAAPSASRE